MGVIKRNGIYLIDTAKINNVSLATIAKINGQTLTRSYVSAYPPAHSDTYVKATTKFGTDRWPYFTTDPAKPLTGVSANNEWLAQDQVVTNQRFHIDLGATRVIKRIYYENRHNAGANTNGGARNFTFWGSNSGSSFAELTYNINTGWVQLTTSATYLDQHAAVDASDPKYITVTNTTAYQYYAFKFADNYGHTVLGVRRIVLQVVG